jgi:hypothetical protein
MESDLSGLNFAFLIQSITITEKEFSHGTTQLRRQYSHYL